MVRILLVEDDATVRDAVAAHLLRAGYDVQTASDGAAGLRAYTDEPADLVLLDLMLPVMGGLELSRLLRSLRPDLPIVMLTARGQELERIQGLRHGADDYVTKPFSMRELELRIRSVLRRATRPALPVVERLTDGDLGLDLAARSATRADRPLALTTREFDLLAFLMRQPGTVHSRDDIITEVWGWDVGDTSTVTVHVRRLREKVEDDPSAPVRLVTVFGHGYRWDPTPSGGH